MLNSNISSTGSDNMVNFGSLTAEIGSRVWGTPARFNEFRVLASLLHRCRATEPNFAPCLAAPGLVHYIYIFGESCPITEFYQVQNSLCIQILHSPILAALLHGTRAVGISQTAVFSRGRHLYSAGRPSRWASAYILVFCIYCVMLLLLVLVVIIIDGENSCL